METSPMITKGAYKPMRTTLAHTNLQRVTCRTKTVNAATDLRKANL